MKWVLETFLVYFVSLAVVCVTVGVVYSGDSCQGPTVEGATFPFHLDQWLFITGLSDLIYLIVMTTTILVLIQCYPMENDVISIVIWKVMATWTVVKLIWGAIGLSIYIRLDSQCLFNGTVLGIVSVIALESLVCYTVIIIVALRLRPSRSPSEIAL
jgi:hypothetical protein